MILDFSIKLGDHDVMVNVSDLECGKFWTSIRELDCDKKAIVDIDATFVSKYSAVKFAKEYVAYYMNEL